MHTTLDILEEPCQGEQSRWETASTTIGHGSYEGFWASSVAVGIVVEDDRIAGNPINRRDPSGLQATPEPHVGMKQTDQGTFDWSLRVRDDGQGASLQLSFEPIKGVCKIAKIGFISVVSLVGLNGELHHPDDNEAYWKQFDAVPRMWDQWLGQKTSWVDHGLGERSPFYNAVWNGRALVSNLPFGQIGVGPNGIQATMHDEPGRTSGIFQFETFAVDMDHHVILGGIRWGFKLENQGAKITMNDAGKVISEPGKWIVELHGATNADFRETPSSSWRAAVRQWNQTAARTGVYQW